MSSIMNWRNASLINAFKGIFTVVKSAHGSVALEASVIFTLLMLLIYLVLDLGQLNLNRGKVERTLHSVASVIRERTYLYDERKQVIPAEVDDMAKVALNLLGSTFPGKAVSVRLETFYFTTSSAGDPVVDNSWVDGKPLTLSYATDDSCFSSDGPLSDVTAAKMSFISERTQWEWVPIYRVTLCVERDDISPFLAFIGSLLRMPPNIAISSIVMPR
ncbi:tight adherence pilus pseudopilin TadF [Yersinia intermedia]|uniref:tight adherence pilus pseudopilin TadF n=1 Tax=Yersinia intermedia TaxID=631 RepID=UPI0022FDD78D|nr:tight adherence pilus pseudopilin TadF [Yersinia intermedia]MDA5483269.1 tight adherence pilus pseudopilin TadF [Yersinia intermedia]